MVKKLSVAEHIAKHSPIDKGLKIKDLDDPVSKYNKILSKIYLGNQESAKDKDFFEKKKIKAVLNCTTDIPHHFIKKDIEYMRIPVEDSLKKKDYDLMYNYMPSIVHFIDKHVNIQGNNILVHCWAGRQRSAIAVASYLVACHNMSQHDACKHILDKRVEAFHFGKSLNFDSSLDKFYKKLSKKKLTPLCM